MDNRKQFKTVDEYIESFPKDIQDILRKIRTAIKAAIPDSEEKISYQMPTFYKNGNLVHYAVFKNHIGFYPTPSAIQSFKKEISKYKWAKGSVQFPIEKPMPLKLISRIAKYRAKENEIKSKAQKRQTKI
jgi:uncharacterized protein YdhG (YjbR/CyaY superfamily)